MDFFDPESGYPIDFAELEQKFGKESACAILRTLELFEGITPAHVKKLSFEERMQNVFIQMGENLRTQTKH